MTRLWAHEPVRVVGVALALILAIVSTLQGEGVISDFLAGQITDVAKSLAGFLVLILPILGAEVARANVTPTSAPSLPGGTIVDVPDTTGIYRVGRVDLW